MAFIALKEFDSLHEIHLFKIAFPDMLGKESAVIGESTKPDYFNFRHSQALDT